MRLFEIKDINKEEPLPTGGKIKYVNGNLYSYIDKNDKEWIPYEIKSRIGMGLSHGAKIMLFHFAGLNSMASIQTDGEFKRLYIDSLTIKLALPAGGFIVYRKNKPYSYIAENGQEYSPNFVSKAGRLFWYSRPDEQFPDGRPPWAKFLFWRYPDYSDSAKAIEVYFEPGKYLGYTYNSEVGWDPKREFKRADVSRNLNDAVKWLKDDSNYPLYLEYGDQFQLNN